MVYLCFSSAASPGNHGQNHGELQSPPFTRGSERVWIGNLSRPHIPYDTFASTQEVINRYSSIDYATFYLPQTEPESVATIWATKWHDHRYYCAGCRAHENKEAITLRPLTVREADDNSNESLVVDIVVFSMLGEEFCAIVQEASAGIWRFWTGIGLSKHYALYREKFEATPPSIPAPRSIESGSAERTHSHNTRHRLQSVPTSSFLGSRGRPLKRKRMVVSESHVAGNAPASDQVSDFDEQCCHSDLSLLPHVLSDRKSREPADISRLNQTLSSTEELDVDVTQEHGPEPGPEPETCINRSASSTGSYSAPPLGAPQALSLQTEEERGIASRQGTIDLPIQIKAESEEPKPDVGQPESGESNEKDLSPEDEGVQDEQISYVEAAEMIFGKILGEVFERWEAASDDAKASEIIEDMGEAAAVGDVHGLKRLKGRLWARLLVAARRRAT